MIYTEDEELEYNLLCALVLIGRNQGVILTECVGERFSRDSEGEVEQKCNC